MKNKLCFLLLIIFSFNSCDLLRFSLFEVTSWTPGEGYHCDSEEIIVSLNFSRKPDTASIERNFSLTGNGNRIKGNFIWNGNSLTFTPLTTLEKNTDYTINLSADAHDVKGLSLDEAFSCNFTTRLDDARPVLLSYYPEMYAEIDDPRTEVRLLFSVSIPLNTLYDNVSFTPSMTGSWDLKDGGKLAVFTPSEPWIQHRQYEIRISSSLTDNNGMSVGKDFLSVFTTGTDHENPSLLSAKRITKKGDIFELIHDKKFIGAAELPVENEGWEKEDKLSLVFSKPVDGLTVKNYLSAEDAPSLIMETSPGFKNEFTFSFNSTPAYESRFYFKLKPGVKDKSGNESKDEYIYRIFANGKYSKPPVLTGLRMPMTPGNEEDQTFFSIEPDMIFERIPVSDDNFPSGDSIQTWIELYFTTAEEAFVDPFSLMELFRIETSNNVLSFSPLQVKTADFSVIEPQSGWEKFERLEITGNFVNSTNFGLVVFQISSGLRDSLGNKNDKTQKISVIK